MKEKKLTPRAEFDKALAERAVRLVEGLDEEARARLGDYFELIMAWNKRLHLVAPCPPGEFATRHVLESLLALRFLPVGATFIDLGSGGGLPAIPCLIAGPDLKAVLFESNRRKSVFLREAASRLGMSERVEVVAKKFLDTERAPAADALTCRAIEHFRELLREMERWASDVPLLLLFGGLGLSERFSELRRRVPFQALLMPYSDARYLFVSDRVPAPKSRRLKKRGGDEPAPPPPFEINLSF